jgi:hypothetical protein
MPPPPLPRSCHSCPPLPPPYLCRGGATSGDQVGRGHSTPYTNLGIIPRGGHVPTQRISRQYMHPLAVALGYLRGEGEGRGRPLEEEDVVRGA